MSKVARLWSYSWPDGSVSLVFAKNVEDAVFFLDQIGGAAIKHCKPVPDRGLFLTFRRSRGPTGWRLDQGECSEEWYEELNEIAKDPAPPGASPDGLDVILDRVADHVARSERGDS